jgi:hypothetical protein
MKSALILTAIVVIAVFMSCAGATSADAPKVYTAPTVTAPTALPASGGTKPVNQAAALSLYSETMAAVTTFVGSKTTSKSLRPKSTTPINEVVSYSGAGPGGVGTVTINGSLSGSETEPDNITGPGTYTYSAILNMLMKGTIDKANFTYGGHTYAVSGSLDMTMDENCNIALTLTNSASTSTATLSFSFGLAYGTSISVRRDDGVGAKFVISYACDYSVANQSLSSSSSDPFTALSSALTSKTGTLTVYDDSNAVIYTGTLTASDIFGAMSL